MKSPMPFLIFGASVVFAILFVQFRASAATPVVILRGEKPDIKMSLSPSLANQVVDITIVRGQQVASVARESVYATTVQMITDSKGIVDFSKQVPLGGWKYTDANGISQVLKQPDVWGPLWNMSTTQKSNLPQALTGLTEEMAQINKLGFGDVVYYAFQNGELKAKTAMVYLQTHPDVIKEAIDPETLPEDGKFKGTLTYPRSCLKKPCAAKVIWGGSGGPVPQEMTDYWANRGLVVTSIEYFTQDMALARPYLTYFIRNTPLEIFRNAIRYTKMLPFVDPSRVLIEGGSRGGEAALEVGVYFGSEVAGVIAKRPIHFTQGSGLTGNQIQSEIPRPEVSSWTIGGKQIPYLPLGDDGLNPWWINNGGLTIDSNGVMHENFLPGFVAGFATFAKRGVATIASAYIPVTKIKCPIAVLDPGADGMWPSQDAFSWIQGKRLGDQRNPNSRRDLYFQASGAGHVDPIPGDPMMESMDVPVLGTFQDSRDKDGKRIMKPSFWHLGGDPLANHQAGISMIEANRTFTSAITGEPLTPLPLQSVR